MSNENHAGPRLLVTGASGKLGRRVVARLLETEPAAHISALVRDPSAATDLAARGVDVRVADYTRPETLVPALCGIDRLLLVSSSEVGRRVDQHRNVIEAAVEAGVDFVAYTSVLHADASPLALAEDHRATEALLQASGLPWAVLRNGFYTENYTMFLAQALAQGAHIGAAGDGLISGAARDDYAEAAAAVLRRPEPPTGRIYELAGDTAFSLADFAAEIARQSKAPFAYRDLPPRDYEAALRGAGLPASVAALLADCDAGVAAGGLFDDGRMLSRLIGRSTTPMAETVAAALAEQPSR